MDGNVVLVRTPRGVEALKVHNRDLPRTSRHALILVDGRSTLADLERKGSMIPEFAAALVNLVERGLVAPVGGAATRMPSAAINVPGSAPLPRAAAPSAATSAASPPGAAPATTKSQALVALATRLLGAKSGKVCRKLDEAGNGDEGLAVAVEACYKLIRLTIDEKQAEAFRNAARDILARQ
jgi:hypothetical protein